MDILRELFEGAGQFMAHGYCYRWTPWIFWSYVSSDLVTFISYVNNFFALVWLYRRRHDIQESWVIPAFGLFILACGVVHGMLVVSVFRGIYGSIAAAKIVMAAVSAPVAVGVWPVVFRLVKMPALEAYRLLERRVNELELANTKLRQDNARLLNKST